ncbi:MAG: riboflavin synthase [Ignavibacteria bacterium]|nr:riboflavin synthase [Ignavibacteria bacterium]
MFTGLVEEIGIIDKIVNPGEGREITIKASKILDELKEGDSINVNGVCQTVIRFDKKTFTVEAVAETIKKTNLGLLSKGDKVNLESSLTLSKKLGGHFVLGHVDTTGKVLNISKNPQSILLEISYPPEFQNYIIHVGSICIEGISLTVASFTNKSLTVSVIPHTWANTNLEEKKVASVLNLEFDVLGKYAAKILGKESKGKISDDWLKKLGY